MSLFHASANPIQSGSVLSNITILGPSPNCLCFCDQLASDNSFGSNEHTYRFLIEKIFSGYATYGAGIFGISPPYWT